MATCSDPAMLAKALAVFFVVVSASPVNAPFFTLDLGELLRHRVSRRDLLVSMASVVSSEDAEAPVQPNLPVSVRSVDTWQTHAPLRAASVPGSGSIDSPDGACHTLHGPAQPLRIAHTPPLAVLRL